MVWLTRLCALQHSLDEGPGGASKGDPEGASKWDIRKKIWDYMEEKNLADFPRPVHHRIPNFKGSSLMNHSIQKLDVFHKASEVKVDPDKPLEGIRLAALQARKTLLVPTPRLRTGLFNKIVPPPGATKDILRKCATSQGVRDYSVPVGLDAKVQIDLIVVGSVAVSEKGYRIGKGEGFADMEYAMMVSMGAIREDTVVITAVHDCQVVDIPEELLGDHDLTVDCILTPTRVIVTGCKRPKPQGILWHKISHEMLDRIPILKNLCYKDQERGKDTTLKDDPPAVPSPSKPERAPQKTRLESAELQNKTNQAQARPGKGSSSDHSGTPDDPTTVYVGNISQGTRVSELKEALWKCGATPARLTWQGAQHRAFLSYSNKPAAELALEALQGLSLGGRTLRIELARNQHNRMASK